jgi:hypothetical protein
MKPKKSDQPQQSGRSTTDERGHTVWEWQTATGSFKRDIDSLQPERVQNTGLPTDTTGMPSSGDPYNSGIAPTNPEETDTKRPRKVDLRKLSDEIKQGKVLPKHQK